MKCFHCGEPVPDTLQGAWSVTIENQSQPMCCIGCQSIAQAIVNAGAEAYYRQRSTAALDIKTLESLAPWATLFSDPQWTVQHVQREEVHHGKSIESSSAEPQICQTTLAIEGLRCGACAWLIERLLSEKLGVLTARANASTGRLFLKWNNEKINLQSIAQRVSSIGYALLPIGSAPVEAARRQSERQAIRRLFIAGLSAAQVMMYAYPEYLEGGGLDDDVRSLMRTASMLITVPVMVYSATPFFESAWRMIRQKRLGMDVPVSLGLIIAFTASLVAWFTNTGEIYFDSVSMFVFLLLGTRWIESRIRAKTASQREKLSTAPPTLAERLSPDPARVAAWNLRVGDVVRVASGDRVPADGILKSPVTDLDTSWLTGESLPVRVLHGARITEGAINLGAPIEILINTPVTQGTLARLSQLAEQAAADRPQWVTWADQIGARFTAGILLITVSLILGAIVLDIPASVWIASVIAVLVVTCPCALSMSGPAAYAAALAKLLQDGVAVSTAGTLERLKSVTDVVFDKTGTLTDPSGSRVILRLGPDNLWPLAAAIAQESTHPIARAIHLNAQTLIPNPDSVIVDKVVQHSGLGLEGLFQNQRVRLGSLSFADPTGTHQRLSSQHPECTVFLAVDGVLRAGFEIQDESRPEAAAVIKALRAQGKTVWCLSGDRPDRVNHLTAELGIEATHALGGQTPERKQAFVADLQVQGKIVAMVGDGHNDAPVLAQADVSLAVYGAAPLAQQKADIYLLRPGLAGAMKAFGVAARSKRVLNQNLSWALVYNLLAIPFAAAGWISPLAASVGMAASSLLVVLNSARLLR